MNLFVADPHWGWWIVLYFFLGGIAAGAYFSATLIEWVGREADRELARVGYLIAFPLVLLCGVVLIVDLDRPERFWHMLVKSEVVHQAMREGWPWSARSWHLLGRAPLLKWWSPMSIGSWALWFFGLFSSLSFSASLWPSAWLARHFRASLPGRVIQFLGCAVGFFVAAYTGSLLTATNQPLWSDSTWIAPLFLTSAASTGIATILLLTRWRGAVSPEALNRLERADLWALGLELGVFAIFVASLGAVLVPVWSTWQGKLLLLGTPVLGLLLPLAFHLRLGASGRRNALGAAAFALVGGFVLRYAILATPPELLARGPAVFSGTGWAGQPSGGKSSVVAGFSPEDGRTPGGGPGADPGNRPADLQPRSKVFADE
jgi:formate-dependent nitrite reductase membrane component NrfD